MSIILSHKGIKARQDYNREWRRKNKERVQKYNAQYWERKAMKNKIEKG